MDNMRRETDRTLRSLSRTYQQRVGDLDYEVMATLAWHSSPEIQRHSGSRSYDQEEEDQLLEGVRWTEDGYRAFDISVLAESRGEGHFGPLGESSLVVMNRAQGLPRRIHAAGSWRACRASWTPAQDVVMLTRVQRGMTTNDSDRAGNGIDSTRGLQTPTIRRSGWSKPV